MDYAELRRQTNTGWNTWDTSSVLSHVLLPYGFAIRLCLKDHAVEHVLRDALIGRRRASKEAKEPEIITPLLRSWDGAYTSLRVAYGETVFLLESAARGGEQLLLATPERFGTPAPALIAEACLLWGREGSVSKENGRLLGRFPDGKELEVFVSGESVSMPYAYSLSPSLAVTLDRPVAVSTFPCTAEQARALLDEARDALAAQAGAFGGNAEAYTAMKSCLAWNSVYDPEHDRVISPVSRLWNIDWGGYVLFHWDTFFAGLMASVDAPELAWLNCIAIVNERTEEGFLPNFGASFDYKTRDRSQPPVGSMAAMKIYRRWGGTWFLAELFDTLLAQNVWFFEHRRAPGGCLCWGSRSAAPPGPRRFERGSWGCRQGAAFESGLDNSPMYDDAVYNPETGLLELADVGLTGLFIHDCRCLEEMAQELGRADAIEGLRRRRALAEEALATLWCPEEGMFLNRDLTTGAFSRRVSPTNFYALFSSRVTDEQKRQMTERWFYAPEKFWGEFILPSITRDDPAYRDQDYWRGRIWAPMNLLVYEALRRAGLHREADVLAEKSKALLLGEWRSRGHVHENYNGDTGEGCDVENSDPFYHWGGLLAWIAIDAGV